MNIMKLRYFHLLLALVTVVQVQAQNSDIAVTIYNDNLALVREVREMQFKQGRSRIEFKDVAAQIDPTSVFFASLTAPDKVEILEQNFEYDLVNSAKILAKYVDADIQINLADGATYTGTLLSASGSDVVLREHDGGLKIVDRKAVENISFARLPAGLITRPTLIWDLRTEQPGKHRTEIGYLTSGMNWHAEYVGVSNKDDTKLDISGWVSIDNQCGTSFENAKLKLVAGDVHRAVPERQRYKATQLRMMAEAATPDGFSEKAFFEYHLYTLERRATLSNNQIKQISLFPATEVAVRKKYVYNGARQARKVRVELEFDNKKKVGLGMALPKGKVRIYKRDEADNSLVLVGEDFIDHTAKDEAVRVYVGNAFDIVAERAQKVRRSIGKTSWEEEWEIKLRNHKDAPVSVTVVETLFGPNWEIPRHSHEFVRKNANTIEFAVSVPQDGETVLNYLVRFNQ